jgi:predicted RNA-binding Zn-ribbon protein involved in translation (DUF1610 family)
MEEFAAIQDALCAANQRRNELLSLLSQFGNASYFQDELADLERSIALLTERHRALVALNGEQDAVPWFNNHPSHPSSNMAETEVNTSKNSSINTEPKTAAFSQDFEHQRKAINTAAMSTSTTEKSTLTVKTFPKPFRCPECGFETMRKAFLDRHCVGLHHSPNPHSYVSSSSSPSGSPTSGMLSYSMEEGIAPHGALVKPVASALSSDATLSRAPFPPSSETRNMPQPSSSMKPKQTGSLGPGAHFSNYSYVPPSNYYPLQTFDIYWFSSGTDFEYECVEYDDGVVDFEYLGAFKDSSPLPEPEDDDSPATDENPEDESDKDPFNPTPNKTVVTGEKERR